MPRGRVVVLSSSSSIFGASFIFHALMDVAVFSHHATVLKSMRIS